MDKFRQAVIKVLGREFNEYRIDDLIFNGQGSKTIYVSVVNNIIIAVFVDDIQKGVDVTKIIPIEETVELIILPPIKEDKTRTEEVIQWLGENGIRVDSF